MTIWLDLTTSASFHPPPTGILRVELNLAQALCEANSEIELCLYESQAGRFSALARGEFERIVEFQQTVPPITGKVELNVERRDLRPGGMEIFARGDILIMCGTTWRAHIGNMPHLYAMQTSIGLRLIAMCHDIIAIKFTHLVPGLAAVYEPYVREMVRHADHVLCPSRCTRRDLLRWAQSIGEELPRASVMPMGCRPMSPARERVSAKVAEVLAQRFLLCVSTIENRKNQQTLCRAYARLVDWGVADLPLLVFAGGIGHGGQDVINEIGFDRRLAGRVIALVGCSDADLAALYRGCLFALYPSLYEGWGLPVSETLANGKFCVCSNQGALPEAGRDFVDYADPWDVDEWANKILRYIGTPSAVAQREFDIRQDFREVSWRDSAAHVLAVASRLADE